MQKTLRIFRKDVSHLWPEILLTAALTLGFALTEHYLWPTYSSISGADVYRTLTMWMNGLMPVAWWLLIARAVHDESLVGDLQFWVTRPYGWRRILIAKLLFIAVFILVPFFLAQCYLLHQAGLHPLAVIPGLLLKLLLLFAFLLLPLLALSTVTPSLTRMLLVFIGFFIYVGISAYFAHLVLPDTPPWTPGTASFKWAWLALLLPMTAAGVTLLQYARRRTTVSASMLLGLVVTLTAVVIVGTRRNGNINEFPTISPGQPAPIQITFNPDPSFQETDAKPTQPVSNADDSENQQLGHQLSLPLSLSEIPAGHAVALEGVSAALQVEGEQATPSSWKSASETYIPDASGPHHIREIVTLPPSLKEKFAVEKVSGHITFAVSEYEAEPASSVIFSGGPIDVPQHGHCASNERFSLRCQYALKSPALTLVTWRLQQTCGTTSPADLNQQQWIGESNLFLDPEFDPVALNVTYATAAASKNQPFVHLCPGTTLTFTRYHLLGRHRVEVTLPPIDPKQYINNDTLEIGFQPESE